MYLLAPGHSADKALVERVNQEVKNTRPTHRTHPETWKQVNETQEVEDNRIVDEHPLIHDQVGYVRLHHRV